MLLIILYIAFVALGLPGALLGSAWPVMQGELDKPVHYAGIITMLIALGTILTSLMADNLTKKIHPWLVVVLGMLLMAVSLFGFSFTSSFWFMCIWAVPLGLGAGAVDAVINNTIAVRYSSRHMSWLHCFWGLGAMVGPYIMGFYLTRGIHWSYGFGTVGLLQLLALGLLIFSLSHWKKPVPSETSAPKPPPAKSFRMVLRIPGVKFALLAFFAYCALESTAGLWASTYLVYNRNIPAESAALFASFFFIGITAGRFVSGFVSNLLGEWKMILLGLVTIFVGIVAVWFSFAPAWVCLFGLIVIGLGCAPIFPSLMHATPDNFGLENSQALVGIQMAAAYTGSTVIPPLFGGLAGIVGIGFFPAFLFIFLLITVFAAFGLKNITGMK